MTTEWTLHILQKLFFMTSVGSLYAIQKLTTSALLYEAEITAMEEYNFLFIHSLRMTKLSQRKQTPHYTSILSYTKTNAMISLNSQLEEKILDINELSLS